MPAAYRCYPNHFELVYSGVVRVKESIDVYNRLSEDPLFDTALFSIVDCRDLITVEYSEEDFRIHASISMAVSKWQRLNEDFRVGVVVPNSDIELAVRKLMQYAETFKQTWKRKIFFTYDEAFKWASQSTPKS